MFSIPFELKIVKTLSKCAKKIRLDWVRVRVRVRVSY